MRYKVEIKTVKGVTIVWTNGGIGYSEAELPRLESKIKADKRISEHKIIKTK